jgi:hypothetical protein
MSHIAIALRAALFTLVVTGLVYPLVITGVSQVALGGKADGSLVKNDKGVVIGSELIGQPFANPAYLQGRPSAAGSGYDGAASSGSNLGTTSQKLKDRVAGDVERLNHPGRARDGVGERPRSAHHARSCALAGAAYRQGPRRRRRARARRHRRAGRGSHARLHRRAARQRAAREPRARPRVLRTCTRAHVTAAAAAACCCGNGR